MPERDQQQKFETAYLLKKTRRRPWGLIGFGIVAALAAAAGVAFFALR